MAKQGDLNGGLKASLSSSSLSYFFCRQNACNIVPENLSIKNVTLGKYLSTQMLFIFIFT